MSAIARTARAKSSRLPYLLRWSDPASRITVEILTEVLVDSVRASATGVCLQGMHSEGSGRTWTVLFCEPIIPGLIGATDASAAGPADLGIIGLAVAEDQRDAAIADLTASGTRLPPKLLLLNVGSDVASLAVLESGSGRTMTLVEFPSSIDQLRRAKFQPFDPVSMGPGERPADSAPSNRAQPLLPAENAVPVSQPQQAGRRPEKAAGRAGFRFTRGMQAAALLIVAAALWFPVRSWMSGKRPTDTPAETRQERSGFGMQVTRLDKNLQIQWDRNLPSMQSAVSGVLKVVDGDQRFAVPLSKSDLAAGQILYPPRSNNLGVELVVETPSGSARDTVRVILAQGEPAVSRPAPALREPTPRQVAREVQQTVPVPAAVPEPVRVVPSKAFSAPVTRARNLSLAPPPSVEVSGGTQALPMQSPLTTNPSALAAAPSVAPPQVTQPSSQPARTPNAPPSAAQQVSARPPDVKPTASTALFQPPVPTKQVNPRLPNVLRGALFSAVSIAVNVKVDQRGNVTAAETQGYSGLAGHLAEAAKDAARGWKFQPAKRDGQPIESDFVIQFQFDRSRQMPAEPKFGGGPPLR